MKSIEDFSNLHNSFYKIFLAILIALFYSSFAYSSYISYFEIRDRFKFFSDCFKFLNTPSTPPPIVTPKQEADAVTIFDWKSILAAAAYKQLNTPIHFYQSEIKLPTRPHKNFQDAPYRSFSEVVAIFSPVPDSPYAHYVDDSLFQNIEPLWKRIPQRKAESDLMAATLVQNELKEYKKTGGLVIVESGGAHSIAIATILAEAGYQPIIKMGLSTQQAQRSWIQEIGAMKYYAARMEQAKAKLNANSPVALIMDAHRDDAALSYEDRCNRSDYQPHSFPTIEEVNTKYKGNIIWVTEGIHATLSRRDDYTPKFLQHYRDAGFTIYQHYADPYYNNTPGIFISLLPE